VIHSDCRRKADLGPVAGIALRCSCRNGNVIGGFRHCTGAAVVTGVAGACTNRIGGTVGVLHGQPVTGRTVAAFAISGNCRVSLRCGFAGLAVSAHQMAVRTLRQH
jgi:hypothetical protein